MEATLDKIGETKAAEGDAAGALAAYQESLAIAQGLARTAPGPDEEADLSFIAVRLGDWSYDLITARKFALALAACDAALAATPDATWMEVNRAHALMFLGRVDEARALYLANRGKKTIGDKLWENVVREDFADLRKAGLSHPLMTQVAAAFTASN